jgi:hypothetical protein
VPYGVSVWQWRHIIKGRSRGSISKEAVLQTSRM